MLVVYQDARAKRAGAADEVVSNSNLRCEEHSDWSILPSVWIGDAQAVELANTRLRTLGASPDSIYFYAHDAPLTQLQIDPSELVRRRLRQMRDGGDVFLSDAEIFDPHTAQLVYKHSVCAVYEVYMGKMSSAGMVVDLPTGVVVLRMWGELYSASSPL